MATPKIDRIAIEFMSRIGDNFVSSFTPGSGAIPLGEILDEPGQIMAYINEGMFLLYNEIYRQVQYNVEIFAEAMPEFVRLSTTVSVTNGNYLIGSPYKDFFKLLNALTVEEAVQPGTQTKRFCRRLSIDKYAIIEGACYDEIRPSRTEPAVIQIGLNTIKFYPWKEITAAQMVYVIQPLNPLTGEFLTQNGNYDSPFTDQWNSQIAEIASNAYKRDRKLGV